MQPESIRALRLLAASAAGLSLISAPAAASGHEPAPKPSARDGSSTETVHVSRGSNAAEADSGPLAFAGAEGFGRLARGGRGGRVITVIQLGDAGPGSLREAVESSGPRTIVFAVAGTIRLTRALRIEHDFITIAGQSAPGQGVTLRDHPLIVAANDVIVRHLRSRLGDESAAADSDALWIAGGTRVILDHVSASGRGETWSISPRRSAYGHRLL